MIVRGGELEPEGLGISKLDETFDTKLVKIGDPDRFDDGPQSLEALEEAARLIGEGQLVAFPTETVYGLGANGLDGRAVAKIFAAKGRPQDNPLILHIYSYEDLKQLTDTDIEPYRKLMDNLWPGPLTLVFKRSDAVPDRVTAGGDTVGVRMPSSPCCRAFLRACKLPIAAPSANLSGRPSATQAGDVMADMSGKIPLILDGGPSDIGIESTVVDLSSGKDKALVLRPGYYTPEDLKDYLPEIRLDKGLEQGRIPKSPGQKYKHYSPKAQLTVFVGRREASEKAIIDEYRARAGVCRVGLLLFMESVPVVLDAIKKEGLPEPFYIDQGPMTEPELMGHSLFTSLREFDREGVDEILGQGLEDRGYGLSIMNRMKKAAGGRVKKV